MKLFMSCQGIAPDPELEAFARAQIGFATYHARWRCRRARVQLMQLGPDEFRCWMQAFVDSLGPVEAGASAHSEWEAIQEAANLLEIACFERLRSRRKRRGPSGSGAAAQPVAA